MMEQTKLWCFEDFDLFESMSAKEIESVEESVITKTLKRGERIHFDKKYNRYVYLLNSGVAKIIATNDQNKHTIVRLINKGNLFGILPLLGNFETNEDYAEAVEDAVICFIDFEKLEQWMVNNDDLRIKVYKQIGEQLHQVENRLLSMIFKDAKARIHEFLANFVKEFGAFDGEKYEVKNFLTNDEIARLTATSRQTVNSILNELRDNHIIEYNKDVVIVPQNSPLIGK